MISKPLLRAVGVFGLLFAGLTVVSGDLVNSPGHAPFAPKRWHIGRVDPRFKLDADQVRSAVERAIEVWESETGRHLFVYDEDGGFPVDFVYDKRQEIETAWHDGREELRTLKLALDQAQQGEREATGRFKEARDRVEAGSRAYSSNLDAYNRRVDYWNAKGGAPRDVLSQLNAERARLATDLDRLNEDGQETETLRLRANDLVVTYNDLVKSYNLSFEKFREKFGKTVKQKLGECLMSGTSVKKILIYAFQDQDHLAIVLAHEFGHAIGLKHVKGAGALMSAVEDGEEESGDLQLTARDRAELRRVVGK